MPPGSSDSQAVLIWDQALRGCAGNSKRPKRYFPFAEGPRNCVGQSLAKVSLVATMATLLQHFSFRLADEVGSAARLNESGQLATGTTHLMLQACECDDSLSPVRCRWGAQRGSGRPSSTPWWWAWRTAC